jgi:DNA primase
LKQYIPDHLIEEIRSRSDILETISTNILLKKNGQNYKGLCPFHSEKTPSFTVSPEKQIYHCFGCGAGGNIFKFIMEIEHLSFIDVVKKLASKYSIALPTAKPNQINAKSNEREILISINQKAQIYFINLLKDEKLGLPARKYLKSRGLNDETLLSTYGIGWAAPEWRDTQNYLQREGKFSQKNISRAGLIKQKEGGKENDCYDRFRGRIMFPFQDIHGNLIAFAGRVISDIEPKYLNSPETQLYIKGNHLFGLNRAKESIRKQNRALLVEGYFDQMRAYQHGIKNTVATCGTALTKAQASLLKNHTKQVTLIFDSDSAGQAATKKGFEVLLEQGLSVDILSLPSGHDPDSFIHQFGPEKFLKELKNSKPFIESYILETVAKGNISTPMGKVEVVNQILPLFMKIKNTVERTEWIRILTEQAKIEDQALLTEFKNAIKQDRTIESDYLKINELGNNQNAELYLVHLMFADKEFALQVKKQVSIDHFKDSNLRHIIGLCFQLIDEGRELKLGLVIDLIDNPIIKNLLAEIGVTSIPFDNLEQAISDCVSALNKNTINQQVEDLKKQRNEALLAGELARSQKLQDKLQELRVSLITG